MDSFRRSPIQRGRFHDLHQPDFTGFSARGRIESCLAPNDGFHECRIDSVTLRRSGNHFVMAMFPAIVPEADEDQTGETQGAEEKKFLANSHGAL